jgi:hypothetical protein
VESNVLLDVLEPDAAWYEWSAEWAVAGMSLLTRDAARYGTSFPTVELITPDD